MEYMQCTDSWPHFSHIWLSLGRTYLCQGAPKLEPETIVLNARVLGVNLGGFDPDFIEFNGHTYAKVEETAESEDVPEVAKMQCGRTNIHSRHFWRSTSVKGGELQWCAGRVYPDIDWQPWNFTFSWQVRGANLDLCGEVMRVIASQFEQALLLEGVEVSHGETAAIPFVPFTAKEDE